MSREITSSVPIGDRVLTVSTVSEKKTQTTTMITSGFALKNPEDNHSAVLAESISLGRARKKPSVVVLLTKGVHPSAQTVRKIHEFHKELFTENLEKYVPAVREKQPRKTTVEPS